MLSPAEVAQALEHTWTFLEGAGTGIRRDDVRTWSDSNWPFGATEGEKRATGGRRAFLGISHCEAMWYIRGCPGVKAAFAALWGEHDLICSFDAMKLLRPWTHNAAWRTEGPWWCGSTLPCCVLGWLFLLTMRV